MRTTAQFVSLDDFETYTGINLRKDLRDGVNADKFLRDCEDALINYANLQSWRPINKFIAEHYYTKEQMTALREAILIQAAYTYQNGNLLMNSGIDPERGRVFGENERRENAIADPAMDKLRMSGILRTRAPARY